MWKCNSKKSLFSNFLFFFYKTQVMTNEEAVDIARRIKNPQKAAEQLTAEALNRDSRDDISCVVVRFRS